MRRRDFIKVIAGSAAALPLAARAQLTDPMRRIDMRMNLSENDPTAEPYILAFRLGLQELAQLARLG